MSGASGIISPHIQNLNLPPWLQPNDPPISIAPVQSQARKISKFQLVRKAEMSREKAEQLWENEEKLPERGLKGPAGTKSELLIALEVC